MPLRIWIYGLDGRVLGCVHQDQYESDTIEAVRNRASNAAQRLEAQGLKVLRVVEETTTPDDRAVVEEARRL